MLAGSHSNSSKSSVVANESNSYKKEACFERGETPKPFETQKLSFDPQLHFKTDNIFSTINTNVQNHHHIPLAGEQDVSHKSDNGDEDGSHLADLFSMRQALFQHSNTSRANSIYTLSRASLANQLSQVSSLKLPDTSTLLSSINAIPKIKVASKLLNDFAEQLKCWEQKATDVLTGLAADDDVEWAAAGGREGLMEVDGVIKQFEGLVDIYVTAIDQLQLRKDVSELSAGELQGVVGLMEQVLERWKQVKKSFEEVKEQVETAMEWEELWNTVLAEISLELDSLGRLVFEMEERRYKATITGEISLGENGINLDELESIVDEGTGVTERRNGQILPTSIGMESSFPSTNAQPWHEDANLLALFARMQPLRASLDFLPMRLLSFQSRGRSIFPTACDDLESRKDHLEAQWGKLEADAEALRRELGEDRWVLVFRNAGRQMLKMCESIMKSIRKLYESLAEDRHLGSMGMQTSRLESFEAKKTHYGAAIERVLTIVDRGIADRFTINGEIMRLQQEMKNRWQKVKASIREMDEQIEQVDLTKSHQLRDSVSTVLSADRSISGSTIDTPNSSPASSVVTSSRISAEQSQITAQTGRLGRSSGFAAEKAETQAASQKARQHTGLEGRVGTSSIPQRSQVSRSNSSSMDQDTISPYQHRAASGITPRPRRVERLSTSATDRLEKPRWNSSTSMSGTPIGHSYQTISANTSSPYKKVGSNVGKNRSLIPVSQASSVASSPTGAEGLKSPLSLRAAKSHSQTPSSPTSSLGTDISEQNGSRERLSATPTVLNLTGKNTIPRLRAQASTSNLPSPSNGRRWSSTMEEQRCGSAAASRQPTRKDGTGSAMRPLMDSAASGRQSSMFVRRKGRITSDSGHMHAEAHATTANAGARPRWR